jgi:hypothetical protein
LADIIDSKLRDVISGSSEIVDSYSLPVKRRIRALKRLHKDFSLVTDDMRKEIEALKAKYENIYKANFQKRKEIIKGEYNPEDNELISIKLPKSAEDPKDKKKGKLKKEEEEEVEIIHRPDGSFD